MGGFLAASRRCAVFVALVTGLVGLHASAAFAVTPSNDDIASATTLTATPVTGSNVGATDDSPFGVYKACDPSCNYGGMSVWYRLPNPGKGWLTVNGLTGIANTNFNAQLAVYNGAADSVTDTSGISSDFNSWQRFGTAVTTDPVGLETTAGNDYFIVVDGYSNGVTVPNGTFKFDWTFTPAPANDDFANAATLTTSVATPSTSVSAGTTGATQQTNEFGISGTEYDGSTFFNNQGGHSVWYKWTAPGTGQVTVDTHGSSFDTVIAMYTGTTLPTLNQITSSDDSGVADTTSQMTFIAASGATYRIAIDGRDDGLGGAAFGAYTLHLNEVIAPANDAFVSAITISGASGTKDGTTAGASLQTNEPEGDFFFFGGCNYNNSSSNQPAGKTVWYKWTPSAPGNYSFDTLSNGTYNTAIAAYTGPAVTNLTQVACNDDYSPSTQQSRMVINATGGQVYWIQVDGADDGTDPTSGTFTLKWAPTPANDDFSNATTISGESGSAAPGSSNDGASVEFGEPQNAGVLNGASVWFNWTAPRNGTFFFKTKGSSFNTTLGIYTGSTVSSLTQVASNDDVNGGDNSSYAQFAAVTGTTYHVSVDGFQGASGSIALAWALVPPPNDDFANATLVTGVPGTAAGTNVGATAQTGEPAFLTGGKTVWWKWVATGNSNFEFDTEMSSIDTRLGVYTGSAVNSLTVVGQNDNVSGGDNKSKVAFSGTSGTTYYIAVDSNGGAIEPGSLMLNWSVPPLDVTAPVINSFTPADGSFVHGAAVPMTGDATDVGSGVASMSFTIDDGSVIPQVVDTTGPFGGTFDSTLLANGTHTIHVTATDTSNNTTSPQTHTFTVDNTGPTITALTPAQGAFVRGPGIVVSADAGDVGSGLASVTFTIDNGAPLFIDQTAPYGTTFDSRQLTNGPHTIYATATDLGNNTMTVAHGITVDNAAPLQPHFTNTLAPFTTATTATVTFADTDATSGIKSYQVQVEKANYNATAFGAWATAPGAGALATTSYKLTGLAAGYDYCFRVIATDKAGNVSIASKAACTARLIDDKTALHSAGWTQGAASTYFGGSASTAKSANRTLTIAGFRGIRLGIMAVQCSTCGAVKIYVGTTLIRTVSLVSAARKDTIILVPVFASRVGTIKIVTTSTKAVTIDGIGASRT